MCGGGCARGNLDLHYLISHSGHTLTRDHVSQTLNKYWGKEKQNILWPHFSPGVSNGRMTGDDKEPDDICSWGGSWMTEWHPPCGWCRAFQARSHMLAGLMLGLTWTRPHHQVRGHQELNFCTQLLYSSILKARVHSLYTVTLFKTKVQRWYCNCNSNFWRYYHPYFWCWDVETVWYEHQTREQNILLFVFTKRVFVGDIY